LVDAVSRVNGCGDRFAHPAQVIVALLMLRISVVGNPPADVLPAAMQVQIGREFGQRGAVGPAAYLLEEAQALSKEDEHQAWCQHDRGGQEQRPRCRDRTAPGRCHRHGEQERSDEEEPSPARNHRPSPSCPLLHPAVPRSIPAAVPGAALDRNLNPRQVSQPRVQAS
jgi:hypothetical protein